MSTGTGALPEVDTCPLCGLEVSGGCVCPPVSRRRVPTDVELEQSRAERLTRAERQEKKA